MHSPDSIRAPYLSQVISILFASTFPFVVQFSPVHLYYRFTFYCPINLSPYQLLFSFPSLHHKKKFNKNMITFDFCTEFYCVYNLKMSPYFCKLSSIFPNFRHFQSFSLTCQGLFQIPRLSMIFYKELTMLTVTYLLRQQAACTTYFSYNSCNLKEPTLNIACINS